MGSCLNRRGMRKIQNLPQLWTPDRENDSTLFLNDLRAQLNLSFLNEISDFKLSYLLMTCINVLIDSECYVYIYYICFRFFVCVCVFFGEFV